jgi:hypothetical protein
MFGGAKTSIPSGSSGLRDRGRGESGEHLILSHLVQGTVGVTVRGKITLVDNFN